MSNKALVLPSVGAPLELQTRSIPKPLPNQLVIKNHALSINPLDTGMQSYGFMVKSFPCVLGSDVSGTIHSIGSSITKFKPGDRVTGFACMVLTGDMNQGAYQEYVLLFENAVTKLPDEMSFEQGAALPMAVATTGVGLFVCMGFAWGKEYRKQEGVILITGASSSVGAAAVQICRIMGFEVFATASPKHHAYLKKLGASQVFDYKDPMQAYKIIDAAKASRGIKYCFAAISRDGNAEIAAKILSAFVEEGGEKAKLCVSNPWPESEPKPEVIEITMTGASSAVTVHREFGAWFFNDFLAEKLESGEFVPSPEIEIVKGGLENGVVAGMEKYRKGMSATKLVVPLV